MGDAETARRWSPTGAGINLATLVFSAALIGAVWIATLEVTRNDRVNTINTAIERNDDLVIAFEEYVKRTIESADDVLQYMIREYLRSDHKFDIDRFVADYTIDNKAFTGVVLADETGNVAATAYLDTPEKPVNVADREHFKVHLRQNTGKVFVGKPVTGRITGKSVIPITRRINKPDGSFGGVAMVLIEPSRLTDLLSDAKMKNLDILTLIGNDGIVRARLKGATTTAGEDVSNSPAFMAHVRRPNDHYFAKGELDGIPKFFSYRTLPDYQLIAVVAAAENDVLANFSQRQRYYFWSAGIASVFITGFTALLILTLRRQQQTVEAASRVQARFFATFNQIAVGIGHADLEGRCLEVNQKLCDITGYTREELVGRNFNEITHPDDVAASISFRRGVMAKPEAANLPQREKRYIRKDGSIVWCQLTNSIVRDSAGNIAHLAAIIQDITEKKKVEQERAQFAAIVESSNDAIISSVPETEKILSWNRAAERMFGWSADEAIGQSVRIITPPEYIGRIDPLICRTMQGETVVPVEVWRQRKDGSRFEAQISFSAVRGKDGKVTAIATLIRDITERRRAEAALRTLSRRLSEVEETERRIIHRELHDQVGASLSALMLDLNIIGSMLDGDAHKNIGNRLRNAQQLTGDTIARIRNVMADLRPPALDDYGLLAALRTHAQSQATRMGIPITVDGEEIRARQSIAVETALFRIVQEALTNIAKHAQARRVAITVAATDDRVTLVIADDGVGFDSDRTSPQRTGWGLRTMRERARAIAADLRIESAPGKGTSVFVELVRETP